MLAIEQRLAALEGRAIASDVRPILVEIVGPDGRTPEQEAGAALAIANGTEVVSVTYRDGRLPTAQSAG
jgi:hypothetical protein